MGVYVRDLLLGQYYFDTLFPRIPVPIMRQITAHLERMNLSTRHAGVTGDTNRHGSDDTARRPPSVKAALSVSFGQRAPHRASTRDSSPVRRTLPRESLIVPRKIELVLWTCLMHLVGSLFFSKYSLNVLLAFQIRHCKPCHRTMP